METLFRDTFSGVNSHADLAQHTSNSGARWAEEFSVDIGVPWWKPHWTVGPYARTLHFTGGAEPTIRVKFDPGWDSLIFALEWETYDGLGGTSGNCAVGVSMAIEISDGIGPRVKSGFNEDFNPVTQGVGSLLGYTGQELIVTLTPTRMLVFLNGIEVQSHAIPAQAGPRAASSFWLTLQSEQLGYPMHPLRVYLLEITAPTGDQWRGEVMCTET